MGIFICLDIMPGKISNQDWKNVYNECITLVNSYPFMDVITDKNTYPAEWIYYDKTKERIIQNSGNYSGFKILGDTTTLNNGGIFELINNIEFYNLKKSAKTHKDDILLCDSEEVVNVFNSKTYGYDYHLYVLSIAVLIESRFPKYAKTYGDISKGQILKSIEWINGILKKPVNLSQRLDNDILLRRINGFCNNSYKLLQMFTNENISRRDLNFGNFIRKNFDKKTITKYLKSMVLKQSIGTMGFKRTLNDYFNMGFNLGDLCEIFINSKIRNENEIRIFVNDVINLNLHLESYEIRQKFIYLSNRLCINSKNPDSIKPDNMNEIIDKSFITMKFGFIVQSDRYIPLETIIKIFLEKLNKKEIKNYVNSAIAEKEENTKKCVKRIEDILDKNNGKINHNYDIDSIDKLIIWNSGNTISPQIMFHIENIKEYVNRYIELNKEMLEMIFILEINEKMSFLIKFSKFCLLKTTWELIRKKANNKMFFYCVYAIICTYSENLSTNRFYRNILNNINLLQELVIDKINNSN